MSFPRYERYKDSGMEWLGEVPEHWEVKRVRHILRHSYDGLKIGPFGSQLTSQMLQETGYKVYGQENVIANDFSRGERFISEEKFQELAVYETRPGDILITMMGTSGRCGITPENIEAGIMDSHLLRIRVTAGVRPKFLQLLIDESAYVAQQIRVLGKGSIMHGLNSIIIKELVLTVPPVIEQDYLLSFLDLETAKIDALIAEQQRLIDLLKEKRQAVISNAVTKGLNPNAPMKDSGIKWLGEVPEHWEVKPIKYVIDKIESGTSVNSTDEPTDDYEVGVLKTSCVYSGVFNPLENKTVVEQEMGRVSCPLRVDTLIVSRMNTPELVGAAGLVTDAPNNLYLPDRLWQISFSNAQSAFVYYWTQSTVYRAFIKITCSGTSSSMQNLGQDQFRSFMLPMPNLEEQTIISTFLNCETAKLDTLTAEARSAIELLKERRTALISAAVTGKIDVRPFHP